MDKVYNSIVFVKCTIDYDVNKNPINRLFKKEDKKVNINKYSVGFIFLNNTEIYALTCFHGIKNANNIKIFINNTMCDAFIHSVSDELDLAILTICLNININIDTLKIIHIDDIKYLQKLKYKKNDNFKIHTININSFIKDDKFKVDRIIGHFIDFTFDKKNSFNMLI